MSGVPGTVNVPCVVVREPGRVPLHLLIIEPVELGRDCAGLIITDPGCLADICCCGPTVAR